MGIYNKLHDGSQGSGGEQSANILTAKDFLNKNPQVKGFSNPTSFLAYLTSLREPEAEQLEQAFNFFKEGVRLVGALVTRKDRSKRDYLFTTFLQGNAQQGCKIILEAGMREFIDAYAAGTVKINFTAEQLMEEAMNN